MVQPVPIPTLDSFTPVNPVTPFTYRDNDTYMTILHKLEQYVAGVTEHVNTTDASNNSAWQKAIDDLTNALNLTILSVYNDLVNMIAGSHDESIADDPTTGKRNAGLSTVVAHVYDNLRIHAYFAKQYDDLGLTCAEYDALNYTARHYDLAPLYPTLNDTMGV